MFISKHNKSIPVRGLVILALRLPTFPGGIRPPVFLHSWAMCEVVFVSVSPESCRHWHHRPNTVRCTRPTDVSCTSTWDNIFWKHPFNNGYLEESLTSKEDTAWRPTVCRQRRREWGKIKCYSFACDEILIMEQQGNRVTCFDYRTAMWPTVRPHKESGRSHV